MSENFQSWENVCFELRKRVKVNEKFDFSHLETFYHLKNSDGMGKIKNSKLNPLSSQKLNMLSLLGFSHTF